MCWYLKGSMLSFCLLLGLLFQSGSGADMNQIRNEANALFNQGRTAEATNLLKRFVEENPTSPDGHYTLAWYLRNTGDQWGSVRHNQQAVNLFPKFAEAYINMGVSYQNLGDRKSARKAYEDALVVRPQFFEGHHSLAILDGDEGKVMEAKKHYAAAVSIRDDAGARIKAALLLPPVFESREEMERLVKNYEVELDQLIARRGRVRDAHDDVGATPFYLAYTGINVRKLMEKLYRLNIQVDPELTFVAPHLQEYVNTGYLNPNAVPLDSRGRIKVGLVSKHLRWHSIGKLMRGLVKKCPRDKLTITVILPPQLQDDVTATFKKDADAVLQVPSNLKVARRLIAEQKFHVLFFPDIGMEAFTYFLAHSRLAPVQCVTHGHPSTTGLPTVDYFVSFKRYEEASAQRFYTETLVRIDGLSGRYERPPLPSPLQSRKDLKLDDYGIRESDHIYLAPQSLFKFNPVFDRAFATILDRDPNGKLCIIQERHAGWGQLFLNRLKKTSPSAANKVVFLPRTSNPVFLNYIAVSEVVLDTYPFGGDTSSRDAFYMGTPVVTLPSDNLPGRYTQGFLKEMGISELIAKDIDDYIELALRIANDAPFRQQISQKLKQRNYVLFEDDVVTNAWANFFVEAYESKAMCNRN